ncbi:transposase [Sporolactobacillus pectinivorans]|uniref:transposase n=1 Tax=Sporolactobacillus pectinivorans TaxID=1591408 RepID=UPI000C25B44E
MYVRKMIYMTKQNQMCFFDLQNRFSNEFSCETHLFQVKWQDGFTCPVCGCYFFYRGNLSCWNRGHLQVHLNTFCYRFDGTLRRNLFHRLLPSVRRHRP